MIKKEGKNVLLLLVVLCLTSFLVLPFGKAAHFIVGQVNNSFDGENADGHVIVLWNPLNGINDNVTDIIGTSGNSGANNIYLLDCELLGTACNVGDILSLKVINSGDDYVTNIVNVSVTGAGFDVISDLRLNSKPNVSLIYPINYGNISGQVNFNCSIDDLDGNLINVTLYGNWTGIWQANETKSISGGTTSAIFGKNISDGIYSWNCLATDDLGISKFSNSNYTFTSDSSGPNISNIAVNESFFCGTESYVRVNCSVIDALSILSGVFVQATSSAGSNNYTAQLLSGNTYYADILLNQFGQWNFSCVANDSLNNFNISNNIQINVYESSPDLTIRTSNIAFNENDLVENNPLLINATIENLGCVAANNFITGFYEGDPLSGGVQIGSNRTISVPAFGNFTTNITWNAKIGRTNIFVFADINNSIAETNETNNIANRTINVSSWQIFYGNVSTNMVLSSFELANLSYWLNASNLTGNVYVSDTESEISWNSLLAFGRNKTGSFTNNDFFDIDNLFNSSAHDDSIQNIFTTDGSNPRAINSFIVHNEMINYVPIVNSTNNSNFLTGILWDSSDDFADGEYSQDDKEDVVFIANVEKQKQGYYGIYDYEIKVPVRLRQYQGPDNSNVYVYFDLN